MNILMINNCCFCSFLPGPPVLRVLRYTQPWSILQLMSLGVSSSEPNRAFYNPMLRTHYKTHVCMYVCMYVCMHACMYVRTCVLACVRTCMHSTWKFECASSHTHIPYRRNDLMFFPVQAHVEYWSMPAIYSVWYWKPDWLSSTHPQHIIS